MRASVVTFPGSNCDKDVGTVLQDYYGINVDYVWHKNSIGKTDMVVLPGGFSYGDYLRPGAMAGFSPAMGSVIDFANKGGKVLGICNGFQILTEAKLLPGALVHNLTLKFISSDQEILLDPHPSGFWKNADSSRYKASLNWPIAHGEGRYFASKQTIQELEDDGQIVIRYKNNPNGSINDIAGISSKNRNVVGMMPHPERALNPYIGLMDGKVFFDYFLGL